MIRPRLDLTIGVAFATVLAGCSSGPELFVDLKTDFRSGEEFAAVEVEVASTPIDETPGRHEIRHDADPSADYVAGVRVAEVDDLEVGTLYLRVTLRDARDAIIAARNITTQLTASRAITVVIARSCVEVVCPEESGNPQATECFNGRCVPPECTPDDPSSCPADATCGSDAECGSVACAATPRCVDSACLCPGGRPGMDAGTDAAPDTSPTDVGTDADAEIDGGGPGCIAEFSGRGDHACVLRDDGTVHCWGPNGSGQLGDGTTTGRNVPAIVPGIVGASDVEIGEFHSCATLATGELLCWGGNASGQLGDGTRTNQLTPVPIAVPGFVRAIGGAQYNGCALTTGANNYCWGDNGERAVGDGTTTDRLSPVVSDALAGFVEITLGDRLVCGHGADRIARCFGANDEGQLGLSPSGPVGAATVVPGLSTIAHIAAGCGDHTCAVLTSGEVYCWGDNSFGQLGAGDIVAHVGPVEVPVAAADEAGVGFAHSCARLRDGSVACWGRNDEGALGDGTTIANTAPVTVRFPPAASLPIVDIELGCGRSCAIDSVGEIWCWGGGTVGNLGNGADESSALPVRVSWVCP